MSRRVVRNVLLAAGILLLASGIANSESRETSRVITGTVFDSSSMKPIPLVTVQIVGTSRSSLTNDDGRFRLLVDSGECHLKFSHVAYYSSTARVTSQDTLVMCDSYMHPTLIEITGLTVYTKSYDAAQQIMVEAIARKKKMLKELQAYSLKAYVKGVVRDRSKPDSANIFAILESQLRYDWEYPDKHKSVVEMRRQTANVPGDAFIALGEVTGIYHNRIDFGSFEVVSPMADDALNYYSYTLEDSIFVDAQRVFVVGVIPRNENEPLFAGTLQIADSSYGLVASDLKSTKGFHVSFLKNLRIREHYVQYEEKYMMPVETRLGMELQLLFPGIPNDISFESVISLHDYSFARDTTGKVFDEYVMEVAPDADKFDSAKWAAQQGIPLSVSEERSYVRIDSVEKAPTPLGKALAQGAVGAVLISQTNADFFHFNRAEGAYVGLGGRTRRLVPRASLRFKSGYAIDGHFWEHEYGLTHEFPGRPKLTASLFYRDQVATRPTIFSSPNTNMTFFALLFKYDFLDYFRERGVQARVSVRALPHITAGIGYRSYRQWSLPINSEYSVFRGDSVVRENPPIADGVLRALDYRLSYDSRPLGKNKGREFVAASDKYLITEVSMKHASQKFLASDFTFRKYQAKVQVQRQMFGLGSMSLLAFGGTSDGVLPPQEHFIVDVGYSLLGRSLGFATLGKENFVGDRVLAIYVRHNFRTALFAKSGLPLIKKLPLFLSVFGGTFVSDFHTPDSRPGEGTFKVAQKAHREIGFGLGNLTPFLSPFNLELDFAWQLSHYGSDNFTVSINVNP